MIVKSQTLKLTEPFITENGDVIQEAVVAYEAYGQKGKPVVFITHGGLSSHHAAGRYAPQDPLPGYWDDIIGPGKVIDTQKYRVLSANSLGSMYGSASPLTTNPATGKPYGPDFPEITLIDMVRFQKAFLEQIKGKDPNCYIRVLNAINSYDLGRDVADYNEGVKRIRCPVLLINISTDAEFPPYWAEELAEIINRKNPGQAQVKIIDSIWGHMGCVQEGPTIAKHIKNFLYR